MPQILENTVKDRNTPLRGCLEVKPQLMRSETKRKKETMNVEEIKKHIDSGHKVTINNGAYKLIKDDLNQYLIICLLNDYCIGLTDSKNNLNMDCSFIRIDKIKEVQ